MRFANQRSDVLFIDPGLMGTGWAFYAKVDPVHPKPPSCYGVIKTSKNPFEVAAHDIWKQVRTLICQQQCQLIVIEFPGLWRSGVSQASAQTGDLFKLTYLIGGIGQVSCETCCYPLLVSPAEWKGQLPKDIVVRRIVKHFPSLAHIKNHEADAVGMGLAAQGILGD